MTESDWPRALWSCDLPTDIINNKEITVKVERGEISITVTLQKGRHVTCCHGYYKFTQVLIEGCG